MRPVEVDNGSGILRLSSPAPAVFVSEMVGSLDEDAALQFVTYADEIIGQHGHLHGFHDWTALMGFSHKARVLVADWSIRNTSNFASLHIAIHSPLVRSTVAVTNLAMRGKITLHDDLESLAAARQAATQSYRESVPRRGADVSGWSRA